MAPSSPHPIGLPRAEIGAFLETLDGTPPNAVTACRGWTAHEIIAHLTSGAEALANQLEAQVEGRPVPPFGSWAEREPPYQAIADGPLRRRLEQAELRMSTIFDQVLAGDPTAQFEEVGFGFPVAELVTHMRQEFAIHRWDLIGDDADGLMLLSQPEFLDHSVRMLHEPLLELGLGRDTEPAGRLDVRIRCAGSSDLLLNVRDGHGSLALADPDDTPDVIDTDAAARLLLVWGRRPSDASRVRSTLTPDLLLRVQTVLSGY